MNKTDRIFVAGHAGLVGAAIVRRLRQDGYLNLLTCPRHVLDLTRQQAVTDLLLAEKPDFLFLAAARVGGIQANNNYPADFIRDNLQIQTNVIDAAWRAGVRKLCFLGSSCIYPRLAKQPMKEEYLLSGPLEPTNEWYAIAKIAGIKMCQAYRKQFGFNAIALMPTNVYGPGDNFSLESSHVLPGMIRKFHDARTSNSDHVELWGSGSPRREFLYVDDLAEAAVRLMQAYESGDIINVGTGEDLTIRELASKVGAAVGFEGSIVFDTSRPDGPPRKLLDISRLAALGWRPSTGLDEGIRKTYEWFLTNGPSRLD